MVRQRLGTTSAASRLTTPRGRALAARMAPQIEAIYTRVEALIGEEFCQRLYRALDDLIGEPAPRPGSLPSIPRGPRARGRRTPS